MFRRNLTRIGQIYIPYKFAQSGCIPPKMPMSQWDKRTSWRLWRWIKISHQKPKPKLVKTEILPKNGQFELRTCGPGLTCLFFKVYSSFPLSLISQQQFYLYFYNDSVLICFLIHSSICSFIINLKFIHGGSRKKTKDHAHIKPLIL